MHGKELFSRSHSIRMRLITKDFIVARFMKTGFFNTIRKKELGFDPAYKASGFEAMKATSKDETVRALGEELLVELETKNSFTCLYSEGRLVDDLFLIRNHSHMLMLRASSSDERFVFRSLKTSLDALFNGLEITAENIDVLAAYQTRNARLVRGFLHENVTFGQVQTIVEKMSVSELQTFQQAVKNWAALMERYNEILGIKERARIPKLEGVLQMCERALTIDDQQVSVIVSSTEDSNMSMVPHSKSPTMVSTETASTQNNNLTNTFASSEAENSNDVLMSSKDPETLEVVVKASDEPTFQMPQEDPVIFVQPSVKNSWFKRVVDVICDFFSYTVKEPSYFSYNQYKRFFNLCFENGRQVANSIIRLWQWIFKKPDSSSGGGSGTMSFMNQNLQVENLEFLELLTNFFGYLALGCILTQFLLLAYVVCRYLKVFRSRWKR